MIEKEVRNDVALRGQVTMQGLWKCGDSCDRGGHGRIRVGGSRWRLVAKVSRGARRTGDEPSCPPLLDRRATVNEVVAQERHALTARTGHDAALEQARYAERPVRVMAGQALIGAEDCRPAR